VDEFNGVITALSIDKLDSHGGVCVLSTHFDKGFVNNGKVNANTETRVKYIARKKGWFVPVSDLLDYILNIQGIGLDLDHQQQPF
jgi:hypothetical protein